jgi:hypothetical protein
MSPESVERFRDKDMRKIKSLHGAWFLFTRHAVGEAGLICRRGTLRKIKNRRRVA